MLKDSNNNNYVKNQNPYNKYKTSINNDILKLYYQFTHLKNIYRQGWLTSLLGMQYENKIESVADHSWAVTILAMSIIEKYQLELDISKCMKLALIHEVGEIYAGYGLNSKYIKGAEAIDIPCLREILEEANQITKDNELPLCFREEEKKG